MSLDDRTGEPKGVTFKYTVDGRTYYFSGSKLDKDLGYNSIMYSLETNKTPMEEFTGAAERILGLALMAAAGGGRDLTEDDEEELKRRLKNKSKGIRM